jgi:hypothetical protein
MILSRKALINLGESLAQRIGANSFGKSGSGNAKWKRKCLPFIVMNKNFIEKTKERVL